MRFVYYVILPLAFGALPYLFLRKDAPVFLIAIQILLKNYFDFDFNHHQTIHLDSHWDWVVYNLTDALWAFSLTSFIVLATRTDSRNTKLFYLFASIAIMLLMEITVGTFDWLDLAAMFIGSCASIAIMRFSLQK